MAVKKLTKEVLIAAHDEINEVIGIEPPIDEALKPEKYEKELYKTIVELEISDKEIKSMSKETQDVLKLLKEKFGEDEEEEAAEEVEEVEEVEESEEEEEEEKPAPKKAAKKPAPAPEKPAAKKAAKKPEPEPEEEEEEVEEEEEAPKKKTAKKEEKATPKKEEKAPAKKEGPKKASETGPGIVASIVEFIEAAGEDGISKEDILKKLKKRFPDRAESSMKSTVNVQVPTRITKEKFALSKTEDGKYFKAPEKKAAKPKK